MLPSMINKKRFTLSAQVTISIYTEVIAETEEEAKRIAETREMASLCYQCTRDSNKVWVPGSGLDGEPQEIKLNGGL